MNTILLLKIKWDFLPFLVRAGLAWVAAALGFLAIGFAIYIS